MNKLVSISISLLGCLGVSSVFAASGDNVLYKEKQIIESNTAYAYNLKLNQVSPLIYSTAVETTKLEQLEEIKNLLKTIIDNQNKLIMVNARKR